MANALTTIGCKEEGTGWTPDMISDDPIVETPDDKVDISNIHTFKAPLYWSVYELCWQMAQNGIPEYQMDMNEAEWDKAIDWMATNRKPYG